MAPARVAAPGAASTARVCAVERVIMDIPVRTQRRGECWVPRDELGRGGVIVAGAEVVERDC